ncbi:beta-lactamase/transpeptidase-like protein [Coniochaeta sp. 2T2.1]|nr:beta-lactamase/transpeptidase-like protein [Coniochaeta sp. 2T2.1]
MDKLDQILESFIVRQNIEGHVQDKLFGAAFIVVDKNGPIYRGEAGSLRSGKSTTQFSTDSQTWVASLTKIITSTCLMQLVERGLVSLDDDVRPRVPELGKMKILKGFKDGIPDLVENSEPITLRNLLTHTVGLAYDLADDDLRRWSEYTGRTTNNLSFTWDGWNTPLKHVPGKGWCYGTAVDWASKLLTALTGLSLGQYMGKNIFEPLGMNDTSFRPTQPTANTCATRLPDTGGLDYVRVPVPPEPPIESGGAGIYTTAEYFGKFLAALLRSSHEDGNNIEDRPARLLKKETVDEMFRPQLDPTQGASFKKAMRDHRASMCPWAGVEDVESLDYGIGGVVNLADVSNKRKRGGMSWVAMNNCHWWMDRQSGVAAVLMCNLLPHPDATVNTLYEQLEIAVYGELLPSLRSGEKTGSVSKGGR